CGRYSWSPSLTLMSCPILRLIDLIVRSGASTHWFLAAFPTSKRPSSDRPTNEGKIGSPSSAKTCSWPSRTTATSLFVVPRSIPTLRSSVVPRRGACCSGYLCPRRPARTEPPARATGTPGALPKQLPRGVARSPRQPPRPPFFLDRKLRRHRRSGPAHFGGAPV